MNKINKIKSPKSRLAFRVPFSDSSPFYLSPYILSLSLSSFLIRIALSLILENTQSQIDLLFLFQVFHQTGNVSIALLISFNGIRPFTYLLTVRMVRLFGRRLFLGRSFGFFPSLLWFWPSLSFNFCVFHFYFFRKIIFANCSFLCWIEFFFFGWILWMVR